MNEAQPFPVTPGVKLKTGLSITSLVLGILSFTCLLTIFTGIPAIITGHIAHRRVKKQPDVYGGPGLALAGLILGYLSIPFAILTVILAGFLLPALAKAKGRAQTISCVSNMKQIGLAARIWSNEHNEVFPPSFVSMSNELVTPRVLVCPEDGSKKPASDFTQFNPAQNVSYEYLVPGAKEADVLGQIAFRCPIHGNVGLGDGSVQQKSGRR